AGDDGPPGGEVGAGRAPPPVLLAARRAEPLVVLSGLPEVRLAHVTPGQPVGTRYGNARPDQGPSRLRGRALRGACPGGGPSCWSGGGGQCCGVLLGAPP